MRIDWRSIWDVLTMPGKAYVLFLLFFCAWNGIALIRHSLLFRRVRILSQQSAKEAYSALAVQQRNLHELLILALILFGFEFFTELFEAIRGWYYSWLNPQADVVAPFDAIQVISQVSFVVFAIVQCSRWYMSAKLDRLLSNQ